MVCSSSESELVLLLELELVDCLLSEVDALGCVGVS